MSVPVFSPPMNPAFPFQEIPEILTDTVRMHKGYDQVRPLLIRPIRTVTLSWEGANKATKDYIFSFFQGLAGSTGPFYWTPADKVPSPNGMTPTLSEVSGGSLGSRTYYVVFTWYDSVYGETVQSQTASLAISANYYMKVEIPPFPNFVSSWRLYAHESEGSECLQATINSSRSWTQSSALATGTATPPSTNSLNLAIKWILFPSAINCQKFTANRYKISFSIKEQII